MTQTLVIYHGHCYDGFTAAWVAHQYFKDKGIVDVEFYAANYQEEPPDCKDKDVFILDFNYPRKKLIKIHFEAKSLLVLDHHQDAEADLKGLSYCVYDNERSGAGMTWDWFFAGKARPLMLNAIEDRDIWKFKHEDTKEAQAYAGTVEMTFENWDELMQSDRFFDYVSKGEAVLKYIAMYGKKAREHARIQNISNFFVPTMNMPYMNCSEHLHALIEAYEVLPSEPEFVASYFRTGAGKWQFSLRSKGDFDVSAIAKPYGGGGHRNAAGFTVDTLPWEHKGSSHTEGDSPTSEAEVQLPVDDKR